MGDRLRVAVTLEQCWHRVPGGTATSTLDTIRAIGAVTGVETGAGAGTPAATGTHARPGAAAGRPRDAVDLIGVSARHRQLPPAALRPPVPVRPLPLPRPLLYEAWHGLRRPAVQRATGRVDVIHATAVAVPPKTAPLVVTVHDLAFLADARHATRHGNRFFRRGLELTRRHADLVLCPSQATQAECEAAGIEPDRLRVVPWGVHPAEVTADQVELARRRYALPARYLVFCGTIEPRKNLPRLLEAFARVAGNPGDHSDLGLVLVGPEGWNEDLAAVVDRGDLQQRVRRLGFLPPAERDAVVAGAEALCYPSLREGFGLPVVEAMALGTPVITSQGSATEEVAGGAAQLVDPLDVASIAAGIQAVVDHPPLAARLSQRGRRRATDFTWVRTAELTVAAYREVAR